jgi:hypothetical protein
MTTPVMVLVAVTVPIAVRVDTLRSSVVTLDVFVITVVRVNVPVDTGTLPWVPLAVNWEWNVDSSTSVTVDRTAVGKAV